MVERNKPQRKQRRAEKLFDPAVEDGSIAAYELRAFLGRMARHPRVRLARLEIGGPLDEQAVRRARKDQCTPADVVGFCRVMNGIRFRWRIAGEALEGSLEVPSLARMRNDRTCGIVVDEEDDELSRTARVLDRSAKDRYVPICLDGDFGYWDDYDSTFQPENTFAEYLRAGITNLFASGWQDVVFCPGGKVPPDVARALALLAPPATP